MTISQSVNFTILILFFTLPVQALTLAQAQNILLHNNQDLAAMKEAIKVKDFALKEILAMYHPLVKSTASYTYISKKSQLTLSESVNTPLGPLDINIDRNLGDNDKFEYGLDIGYPIFPGMTRKSLINSQRHALQVEKLRYKSFQNHLLFSLGITYIQWYFAYTGAKIYKDLCETLRHELQRVQALYTSGVSIQAEVLGAEAELAKAEYNETEASSRVDSLSYEICQLLGIYDSSFHPEEYKLTTPENYSFNPNRTEVTILDETILQLNHFRKSIKGKKAPHVSSFLGFRAANPGLNLTGDEFMAYGLAGLSVSWDIYDGFANKRKRQGIAAQISGIKNQKTSLQHQWEMKMKQAQIMLNNSSRMRETAVKSLKAATSFCNVIKEAVNAGTAVSTDYLKATMKQNEAEIALVQTYTIENLAKLKLHFTAGYEIDFTK